MYKKFFLEILNPANITDTQTLEFDLCNTELAQKWASEINQDYDFYERDRFTYFPSNGKDNEYFANKLNQQIDIINSFYPNKISMKASSNMDQETMNEMHVFFEQLRGPIEDPLEWYINSPPEVKKAIERLNLLTHEYEYSELYKKWNNYSNPMIVGTYEQRPRFELTDEQYNLFTYRFVFGGVYINYCVVGKPLLDVFLNQDKVIGDNNIRPQRHWSADWMIKFGQPLPEQMIANIEQQFWDWFESNEAFFNNLDIYRGSKMALGQIPVAIINMQCDVCKGLTSTDIVKKLAPYQNIKSTWVE